jgi:hypothetical protein
MAPTCTDPHAPLVQADAPDSHRARDSCRLPASGHRLAFTRLFSGTAAVLKPAKPWQAGESGARTPVFALSRSAADLSVSRGAAINAVSFGLW